jgi:hypothetical protein
MAGCVCPCQSISACGTWVSAAFREKGVPAEKLRQTAVWRTDNLLRKLPAPESGNKVTYDDAVKGFGIRVTAAGGRAFILNYRRKLDLRERRITLGSFPDWSTTAAREEARRLKRAIDGGADPVGEQEENRAAATVADLCARFERDYLPRNRPSTQRVYKQQIIPPP